MTKHQSRSTFDHPRDGAAALLASGVAFFLLLLVAAPWAYAQGMGGPAMMHGPGEKGGGMMHSAPAMHPGPGMQMACRFAFYLPFADRLSLSAEQMKSLEDIRFQFEKESISRRAAIATAALELQHAQDADNPDDATIEGAIRDLYAKKTDQAIAAYRAEAKATNVLTPEQRAQAKKLSLAGCGMGPHGMMMHHMMAGGMTCDKGPGGMSTAPMHGRRTGGAMMGGGAKSGGGMMGGGTMGGGTTGGPGQGQTPQASPTPGSAE